MKEAGISLTIVSNGAGASALRRNWASRTSTVPPKPLPFALMAARRMGVKRKQMAMVGDQLYADRMAAALYGIPGLMVHSRPAPTSARGWCSSASGKAPLAVL